MQQSTTTQVLTVDDHQMVCLGIASLIENMEGYELAGMATTVGTAIDIIKEKQPDIIILDLIMGGRDGLELIQEVNKYSPKSRILIYSMSDEETYGLRSIKLGASGYLSKKEDPKMLIHAIETLNSGNVYLSHILQSALVDDKHGIKGNHPLSNLSNNELRVFQRIGQGLNNKEIAKQLSVSTKTVSSYKERLKNKLSCNSMHELSYMAKLARENKGNS